MVISSFEGLFDVGNGYTIFEHVVDSLYIEGLLDFRIGRQTEVHDDESRKDQRQQIPIPHVCTEEMYDRVETENLPPSSSGVRRSGPWGSTTRSWSSWEPGSLLSMLVETMPNHVDQSRIIV